MSLDYFKLLCNYYYWANERVLSTAEQIQQDSLDEKDRREYARIHETLVHIAGSEWIWRSRWQGVSPASRPTTDDMPTLAALRARWHDEERQSRAFIESLREDDLSRPFTYTNFKGVTQTLPLGPTMLHLVNHGTQHRSEVAMLLTELGHSPGDLDLHLFVLEQNQGS